MFKTTETERFFSPEAAQRASLHNPELPVEFIRSILVAQHRQEVEPFTPEEK